MHPFLNNSKNNDEENKDIQQIVSENVNERLEKAMGELQEKHRLGTNEIDDPDRAPTGEAYRKIQAQREAAQQERLQRLQREQQRTQQQEAELEALRQQVSNQLRHRSEEEDDDGGGGGNSSEDDDDFLDDENDPIVESIRARRIEEMRKAAIQKAANIARGHGDFRTISQDEFLPECTGTSEFVAVHFFHKEFERCKILDHHLKIIAPLHIECKFLRIDAEKTPFFVSKLQIRTLPTLLVFRDGKAINRLTGFEGLSRNKSEPDKWETSRLQRWLADETGAITYKPTTEDLRADLEGFGLKTLAKGSIYRGGTGYHDEEW